MKTGYILFLALAFLCIFDGYGQQEYQFSQVTKSVEFINPAYSASKQGVNGVLLHRNQWTGTDGAPRTLAFNAHVPIGAKKLGIGCSGVGEYVGLREMVNAGLTANAHTQLSEAGYLAGGLFAGAQITRYNSSDATSYYGSEDLSGYNETNPVVGLGTYFFNEYVHLGLGAYYTVGNAGADSFTENMNVNANVAGIVPVAEKWNVKPYLLAKYSTRFLNAYEGGLTVLWNDIVWLGGGYRFNSAVIASVDVRILQQLRIGYSYDYSTGVSSALQAGSHEIRLSFELAKEAAAEQMQFR